MEASEILSAFVDGEPVDPGELARALGEAGARETLIDFVRLRMAVADDSGPSDAMVVAMRARLADASRWRARLLLRLAAAVVVGSLATVGAYDLARGRKALRVDEPPVATRVIRFEPGVDWKAIETPSKGR